MRILLVCPIPPDPRGHGGIPLVLDGQLQGLSARHDVTVATIAGPDAADFASVQRMRDAGVAVHAVERREPVGRARWKRRRRFASMWLGQRVPWRTVWFHERAMQTLLDELLAREDFDLIAVEDDAMGVYDYGTRVPTVLTEHEVLRPRAIAAPPADPRRLPGWAFREIDWRRWTPYQRTVWERFDRLHTFTTRDQAALIELAPACDGRVRAVPFGLPLPTAARREDEVENTLVFTGNFTHHPNVEGITWFAETILPELVARRPSLRLIVAGAMPPPEVTALASEHVEVIADPEDIEALTLSAGVLLAPMHVGGGMRVKVVQALGLGKATVATTRSTEGLKMPPGEPPLIISDDPQTWIDELDRLLGDPGARRALGDRARAFAAQELSAEAYGARLIASYEELLAEHGSRR